MKTLGWIACGVALGIFLASYEVDGKTPLAHAQRAWKSSEGPAQINGLKDRLGSALEDARDTLAQDARPHEHHSEEDRAAVKKLIAGRAGRK